MQKGIKLLKKHEEFEPAKVVNTSTERGQRHLWARRFRLTPSIGGTAASAFRSLAKYCEYYSRDGINGGMYACDHFCFPREQIGKYYQKTLVI